jgi:enamine deaminase RidA (YjgF/YER057c/UK114 family)
MASCYKALGLVINLLISISKREQKTGATMKLLVGVFIMMAMTNGAYAQKTSRAEENLKKLGITLPTPPTPVANYVTSVRVGNLLFLAGHGPTPGTPAGKVGKELTLEQGAQAARQVGLNLLATTRAALGSLDKVKRVVKVLGMVNSAPGFADQPKVINGFSDLMVEVFGEAIGKHARSAVGMAELPNNIPVEIEMILEVE